MKNKETLEEAGENYARKQCDDMYDEIAPSGGSWGWETSTDFIAGAKWQQEQDLNMVQGYLSANLKNIELLKRSYSEEDIRLAIKKARDISDGKDCFDAEDISGCTEVCTYGWKFNMSEDSIIEQFKKK